MPAAVATGVQINGQLKNKKIVFNDDGEAQTKPVKEEHNSNSNKKVPFPKRQNKGQEKKPQSIKFDEDEDDKVEEVQPAKNNNNKLILDKAGKVKKPQRIKFDDDGAEKEVKEEEKAAADDTDEEEEELQKSKKRNKYEAHTDEDDAQKKWYQVHTDYPCSDEVLDMKENEQLELFNLCKNAYDAEKNTYNKRNPTDARWLQTALHKGTAKDRANAGALLVTSNPLGNLEALSNLIGFCKISNKSSNDVIAVLTDLWQEVLLPPQRKLLSIHTRGADWKQLKKQQLHKDQQRRLYAYWYFENELKDQYHEFLKNLMQGLQTGQEHNKMSSIVAAARLLAYAPEKEQMLLTMLINKLGDPVPKIASKALHHLSEVAKKHPNMCGVIVAEAEKLLFRNNISERAQHFALCFLSSIAPSGRPEVCTKLVNICFALFKVLVQKGAVNNRTMQAILRCLQKAITEAQPAKGSSEILTKEMQDTIYRLVHLADIRVSVQTLGLLLQLITVKTEKSDRFYNALYIKLVDLNLINIGSKTAAQLLHIVHRAIHIDAVIPRAQAFVKRLLQLALYAPPNMAAGCLIVLHKLLRLRKELLGGLADSELTQESNKAVLSAEQLDKFGSDEEEIYKDVVEEEQDKEQQTAVKESDDKKLVNKQQSSSSWHHLNLVSSDAKVRDIDGCKYDPYHRVPAFAGAGYALRNELLLLRQHYHPTVQVFAEQIMLEKRIDYYGDPLRDFGLPHFLERFAFKNPKKLEHQPMVEGVSHKRYTSFGARGKPVRSLTKSNCTEDEMFIFNYLEQKRKHAESMEQQSKKQMKVEQETEEAAEDEDLKEGEVDDDEFENYLDNFFGKKLKDGDDAEQDEEELNYLQELGGELQADKSKKKQKKNKQTEDDDMEDMADDWDDDDDEDAGEMSGGDEQSDDETGSIDLEPLDDNDDDDIDDDDDEAGSISMDGGDSDSSEAPESPDEDDDEDAPKSKKSRKDSMLNERGFAQKLKHSNDMTKLFAGADEFSALLEETGKSKGQGTSNAVFNKDKSSDKQLKWEEKRRSNSKNYTSKKFNKGAKGGGGGGGGKKRKH
ncbi:uncharacterized protein F23B12.7 [Drosophila innubila]|uniref:uncharacterized protein F23B12.7 n=1 Tax=Drosophila innubila TaxID=198719 RepID=UPI00148BCF7D|nr:uncharacterized protein F23B12.7 [Drosophila innubila]